MNPLGTVAGVVGRSFQISVNAAGVALCLVKKGIAAAGRSTSEWVGNEPATATAPEATRIMDMDTTAEPDPGVEQIDELAEKAEAPGPAEPEPVNVVEELDLDPAPADEPTPTVPGQEPVTTIDAAADPDHVEATPADVAEAVSKNESP